MNTAVMDAAETLIDWLTDRPAWRDPDEVCEHATLFHGLCVIQADAFEDAEPDAICDHFMKFDNLHHPTE